MTGLSAAAKVERPRWPLIAAALVAIAIYGLLALGSGLDRIAAAQVPGGDAGLVPPPTVWPFGAGHARVSARSALIGDASPAALAAAREAVRRDPLDADGLGLLGEAARQMRDTAYAARVFGVAARLGWREPLAQGYALQTALAHGDYHAAADHLDALLRQSPDFAGRNLLLSPFDASPAGRRELAKRLARRPAWALAYFGDTAAITAGDPLARGDVAMLLAREAGVRDCALIAPVIGGLARHDHLGRARALYRLHCARSGEPAVPADGRFIRADAARAATWFDWRVTDDGTIGVAFEARPGVPGRAAIVSSSASLPLPFASQPLDLAPGHYRLTWQARDGQASPATSAEVALTCGADSQPGGEPWLAKRLLDPASGRFGAAVTIPADCPRQTLLLGIGPGASDIAIGDVAITAAASVATP